MKYFFVLFSGLAPLWAQLEGSVVHGQTQVPLEGAVVRIQKHLEFTTSAADGSFSLQNTEDFPIVLTAALYGYFNGFVVINSGDSPNNLIIELDPISLEIEPNHPLNEPDVCGGCHPDQYDEWMLSPMAKTGLNTWVFDLYNGEGTPGGMNGFVYQRDSVHRFAKPNSECSACHSPVHWLTDIETAGMGDIDNPTPDMERGVQCEVCHRAYDVNRFKLNFPGVIPEAFTFLRGPQHLEFGLKGDSIYTNFIMRPAYNPMLSDRLCAACHEDNVDVDDDDDFEDAGSVPHETTYSEWQQYRGIVGAENAKTCIECHMPATNATSFCLFEEDRLPGTIRYHDIRGTTPDFLENAVSLNANVELGLGILTVHVDVHNDLTGHAVPTGVVIRNMILLVEAFDGMGQRLTQRSGDTVDAIGGAGDPADGYYAGLPGQSFYKNMTDGVEEGIFYTDAIGIASDTRIQPQQSYLQSFGFSLGDLRPETVDVDVRLVYRRSFRDLLDQKGWVTTGHGGLLEDLEPPHYGHLMERFQSSVAVCSDRDLDMSTIVDLDDLLSLNPLWPTTPPPFGPPDQPRTSVGHFVAVVNCVQSL